MLRALVQCHHQRLSESALQQLFPSNEREFIAGVTRAADYVIETCGGPAYFTSRHGKPCMRKRHFPFTIDEAAREIWLRQLWLAFDDVGFPEQLREEYWNWVEPFSIRMINRRTQRAQPQRYAFRDVPSTLLQGNEAAAALERPATDGCAASDVGAPNSFGKCAIRDDMVQKGDLKITQRGAVHQSN